MQNAWEEQQKEIERVRMENPSLLERDRLSDPDVLFARVGITGLDSDRPRGYVRYAPGDHLVQERCRDGRVCPLQVTRSKPDRHGNGRVLHGHLIKEGCSTQEAIEQFAATIGIAPSRIRHAGRKERQGKSSQRVSVEDVDWERVAKFQKSKDARVRFEPLSYEDEHVTPDDVMGNRFTILVRHDGNEHTERLKFLLGVYGEHGFINFFPPAMFGARSLNHKLGCLILRGDTEGVLQTFFVEPGPEDLPLFRATRERLAARYGDWSAMKEVAGRLPHTFGAELKVLEALERDPKKTRRALSAISHDLERWVHAYGAWLFNRTLSESLRSWPVQEPLPLFPDAIYAPLLRDDGVGAWEEEAKRMGVRVPRSFRSPRVRPDLDRVLQNEVGTRFTFSLPNESDPYAFLSHLYRLHEGHPVPGWVRP